MRFETSFIVIMCLKFEYLYGEHADTAREVGKFILFHYNKQTYAT